MCFKKSVEENSNIHIVRKPEIEMEFEWCRYRVKDNIKMNRKPMMARRVFDISGWVQEEVSGVCENGNEDSFRKMRRELERSWAVTADNLVPLVSQVSCQTDAIQDLVSFKINIAEIHPFSEMNNKNWRDFPMCVCLIHFLHIGSRGAVNQKREKWNFLSHVCYNTYIKYEITEDVWWFPDEKVHNSSDQ
jgi:hypothetical protein